MCILVTSSGVFFGGYFEHYKRNKNKNDDDLPENSNENYSIPKSLAPLPQENKRKTDEVDAFVINKKKKTEAPKEEEWADLPQVSDQTAYFYCLSSA